MHKIHTEVVTELQALKSFWPVIARASNVPLRTLYNVANGTTRNPKIMTLEKLLEGMARISLLEEKRAKLKAREQKGAAA